MTDPENKEVLINFYQQTNPGGPGWSTIVEENKVSTSSWSLPSAILALFVSLIMIYNLLFATGYFLYGNIELAIILLTTSVLSAYFLRRIWKKIGNTFL